MDRVGPSLAAAVVEREGIAAVGVVPLVDGAVVVAVVVVAIALMWVVVVVVVVVAIAWHFSWIVVIFAVHFQEWAVNPLYCIECSSRHQAQRRSHHSLCRDLHEGSILVAMACDIVPVVVVGETAFP